MTLATREGSHTKYGTRRHFNQRTIHPASLGVADHARLNDGNAVCKGPLTHDTAKDVQMQSNRSS